MDPIIILTYVGIVLLAVIGTLLSLILYRFLRIISRIDITMDFIWNIPSKVGKFDELFKKLKK